MLSVSDWGIQKANANSNLQEHMVQRGKVDKRRDRGGENRDSEQSRYHVIVFTVHLRLTEKKILMPADKVRAERFERMNETR